jgi:membrane fusion protein (multidrug efflux system)
MNRAGKWIVALVVLGVVVMIGYRVLHRNPSKNGGGHREALTSSVFVTQPSVRPISQTITLTADIQAINTAAIYSQVSGYLESISVRRGYHVKKGQVLAKIDDTTYRAQLKQAVASRDYSCLNAKRYKELLAKNLVSQDSYDLAEQQCQQAQAAVDYSTKMLAYTNITAPFDGYIFNRMVDPGATIPASTGAVSSTQNPLFTVVDTHIVKIVISVPESDVRFLKIGLPIQVRADAFPGRTFPGKITRMNPALDTNTRTLAVEIDMDNPDETLKPGMFARAKLHLRTIPDAVVLPKDAVVSRKKESYVWRVDAGNIIHKVPVSTGIQDKNYVQILDGASPSDTIAVVGQQQMTDGETIIPKPYVSAYSPDKNHSS